MSSEPRTLEDFNSDFFSLMCNVGDCDAVALAAIDTQGELEFCVPSGPVNEAEIPPASVAGVDRSRYRGSWYKAMETDAGTRRLKHIHGVG